MESPEASVRLLAVRDLADSDDHGAVDLLRTALGDPDPRVRREAIDVLGPSDAAEAAGLLAAALYDDVPEVRDAAAFQLSERARAGDAAVLLDALAGAHDAFVASSLLRALKPLRAEAALPVALGRIEDADPRVRGEAVGVLGYLRATVALPALASISRNDPDDEVRLAALGAMRFADAAYVAPVAIDALEDPAWSVRATAAQWLGKLSVVKSCAPLIQRLDDSSWQVREQAAMALGALRAPEAVGGIGRCTRDGISNVRKSAVLALAAIGGRAAEPFLAAAAADPDAQVRKLAQQAMDRLRH
jgi:HEAT repeat protein